jgi:probable phosphoglycerate mutase
MEKSGKDKKETRLYLVRHGETFWNVEDKMQGVKDSPLTEKGVEHAKQLGEKLLGISSSINKNIDIDIDKIFSSDLGRAYETSVFIGKALNLVPEKDERLRERNMGIFEGYSWDYVREHYPEEFKKTVSEDNDYKIPEGESKREYIDKINSFLQFIISEYEGKNILAVTHRGFINFVFRIILSIPFDAKVGLIVGNAVLAGFVYRKGRWMLERFGNL